MLPIPDDYDALDRICVEWDSGPVKNDEVRRCSPYQTLSVKIKEPAIGGYYNPSAFSVLVTIPDGNSEGPRLPEFTTGDFVEIQLKKLEGVKLKDEYTGKRVRFRWVRFFKINFIRVITQLLKSKYFQTTLD